MDGVTGRGTTGATRKIMVIADPGRESIGALQWALSHAILENDELILLHVENSSSWRRNTFSFLRRPHSPSLSNQTSASSSSSTDSSGSDLEFLEEMKCISEAAHPNIKVHIEKVEMEGKDKAYSIILQCKAFSVDILVIGQRRSLSNAILGCRRSGANSFKGSRGMDTAEYLIDNSKCTCVGVQKKGQTGGYVLNTKTHKNFWLLA